MYQNTLSAPGMAYEYPNMMPLSYEQRVNYFYVFRKQQRDFIEKRLKESYPTKFVIVYGILMILHSIAQIALHIVLIIYKGANYNIYHGIWGGGLSLLMPVLALLLIKFRNIHLYRAAVFVNMLGATLVILGIILASGFGLMEYERIYSRTAKKYLNNANRDMMPVTITMLVLAILAFIFAFVYLIVVGTIFKRPTSTVNYSQNNQAYPVNLAMNYNNMNTNTAWNNAQAFPNNSPNQVYNNSFALNTSAY